MGRLAFDNQAKYTDFTKGYELYVKRSRKNKPVSFDDYRRIVKAYCKHLSEKFDTAGMIDLPCGLGMITTALITRKPKYRDGRFVGFGAMDWNTNTLDGTYKAFGFVYLPRHRKKDNLRCYGFVANRRLFKRIKEAYKSGENRWIPMEFDEKMI